MTTEHITNESLVKRVIEGDESAEKDFFDEYKPFVENLLAIFRVPENQLDDAVSLVLIKVFKQLPRRDSMQGEARLRRMLNVICNRVKIDIYRKETRRESVLDETGRKTKIRVPRIPTKEFDEALYKIENGDDPDTLNLLAREIFNRSSDLLDTFFKAAPELVTDVQKQVFRAAMLEGKSFRQISRDLKLNKTAVRSLFTAACHKIRNMFYEQLE